MNPHLLLPLLVTLGLVSCRAFDVHDSPPETATTKRNTTMSLGNFSVSLTVKDLQASLAFYKKLGFVERGGNAEQNWLVLRNGDAILGLFQGMFEKNLMTFNPGWDKDANTLAEFEDVRAIQKRLQAAGIELTTETDPNGDGPGHITLIDPDGNPILIDQHAK